jgi:cytochrome b561
MMRAWPTGMRGIDEIQTRGAAPMSMPSPATTNDVVAHYDPVTIRLHWATAGLASLLWVMGQTTGWLPRGPLRVNVWSVHILLGVCLALVLVARIVWRGRSGRRLPAAHGGLLQVLAKGTHYLLYLLLIAVVGLGLTNAFAHAFPMFNAWALPGIGDKDFRHMVNHWHELAANAVMIVALLHAAAALFHHYVLRDGVLDRMLADKRL